MKSPFAPWSTDGIPAAVASNEASLGRFRKPLLRSPLNFAATSPADAWGHMLGPPRS